MEVSVKRSSNNSMNPKSFQFQVARKRRMVDEKKHSNDVSICPNFCFAEPSQIPPVGQEDDVDDDNLGEKMNKQVPLEGLNPTKTKLNYD